MTLSALTNYANAAKLQQPKIDALPKGPEKAMGSSAAHTPFQSELSSLAKGVLGDLKNSGVAAEQTVIGHIFGKENHEKTAMSLQEFNTHLEIASQALRLTVEKLTELTKGTMGG